MNSANGSFNLLVKDQEDYADRISNQGTSYGESKVKDDVSDTWPWIKEIQENGDLLFILHNETPNSFSLKSIIDKNKRVAQTDTSPKRFQSKLKTVLKKSRSFGKKDNINVKQNFHTKIKDVSNDSNQTSDPAQSQNTSCINVFLQVKHHLQSEFINLENLFGIITGLDLDPVFDYPATHNGSEHLKYIIVQGLIANSPAEKCAQIRIGDYLVAVNGVSVDLVNIDSVLIASSQKSEFILTIERKMHSSEELSILMSNLILNELTPQQRSRLSCYNQLCVFANLTLDANEKDAESDITLWFPDTEYNEKIRSIRGVFVTLSDVLKDVTLSQTDRTKVWLDNAPVNIAYHQYKRNVIFLAIPEANYRCSDMKLNSLLKDVVTFLCMHFSSLERSFEKENIHSVKHLVMMFLEKIMQDKVLHQPFGISSSTLLTNQHYVDISSILSDSQAADYGECIDDFFPHRRLYSIYGTCLFYKASLVCSHLPDHVLKDVLVFCKYHWLHSLMRENPIFQLVLWKEVFLTTENEDCGESGFITPNNLRWFILIVGQSHSLFCTILEVGGIASIPDGNPGPHPYYVDTASSILSFLVESYGLEKICEEKLTSALTPATVKAKESANPRSMKSPRSLVITQRKCVGNYWNESSDTLLSVPIVNEPRRESWDSSTSGSNHDICKHELSSSMASSGSINISSDINLSMTLSTKLTSGYYNTLFYFTIVQNHRGVYIAPQPDVNAMNENDSLTTRILESFNICVEKIHSMFIRKKNLSRKSLEHGVLFHIEQNHGAEYKVNATNIAYWVVGRVISIGKSEEEIYLCYQDGIPQNLVEMAFKLRFGTYS